MVRAIGLVNIERWKVGAICRGYAPATTDGTVNTFDTAILSRQIFK